MISKTFAFIFYVSFSFWYYEAGSSSSQALRGPPVVETAPVLLNSFLPASMQIIAHLTDLMKYELHPASSGSGSTTTTTTTVRPTSHHKPGIYSPNNPLGSAAYFARTNSYQEYVHSLNDPQRVSYFDRYKYFVPMVKEEAQAWMDDLNLLGQITSNLLKQINSVDGEEDFVDDDEDGSVKRFIDNYDDFELRSYVIGNKRPPPTRAYVTLLSLYDMLNKESKKLQLNKYGGYTEDVLRVLMETSSGTAALQLQTVLMKIVEKRDTKDPQIINKIKALVNDLQQSNSYINDALRYIPTLKFTL